MTAAFGFGPHVCLGAHLARIEMAEMLSAFARQAPDFVLDPDRPVRWKPRGDIRGLSALPVRFVDAATAD